MYQRILIPTDGSSYSEAALPHGLRLARQLSLPVVLLYVLEETLPPLLASSPAVLSQEFVDEYERSIRQAGEEALDRAQQQARVAGVTVERKLVRGSPALAILAEAKPTDLIVMGTHGRNSLAAFVLGSVTMRVLHEAPCPVLAVPSHSQAS
jgi:nucleotide-binding universal stress UspA family protein